MSLEQGSAEAVFQRQRLLLERLWALLEGLKQLRNQVPVVTCTAMLASTGFVLNSGRLPSSRSQALGMSAIVLAIAGTGEWVAWIIQSRYTFVNDRISHLYRRMGITGENYFHDEGSPLDSAKSLFLAVYVVIGIIGFLCALGIALAPLAPSK